MILKKKIQELLENLFFSLQNEEILLVFETLDILKDVFLCMGEISNALNSCYHLVFKSKYIIINNF